MVGLISLFEDSCSSDIFFEFRGKQYCLKKRCFHVAEDPDAFEEINPISKLIVYKIS